MHCQAVQFTLVQVLCQTVSLVLIVQHALRVKMGLIYQGQPAIFVIILTRIVSLVQLQDAYNVHLAILL